jgi:hypothetical protein
LRAENAQLKSKLHKAESAPPPKPAAPESCRGPGLPGTAAREHQELLRGLKTDIQKRADEMKADVDHTAGHIADWAESALQGQGPEFRRRKVERSSAPPVAKIASGAEHVASAADRHAAANGEVKLNRKAERMVMSALIQYPEGLTVRKLATITGYAKGGGGFRGALSKLRTAGYIEGRDHLVATDAGRAALPDVEPMPTGQALLDHWLGPDEAQGGTEPDRHLRGVAEHDHAGGSRGKDRLRGWRWRVPGRAEQAADPGPDRGPRRSARQR